MPPSGTDPESPSVAFLVRFVATGAFSGYSPWASGTVGTALGVLLYLIPGIESPTILGSLIALTLVAGAYTAGSVASAEGHRLTPQAERAKERFQPDSRHGPDPSIVVIDEIVGMWIALLFLPKTLVSVLLAFVLFRVMDVVKPEPARSLERLPGGWGIMMDDVAAGIYANLASHALLAGARLLFPGSF
jgi:phosphatidylglycerophosphatase A